MKTQGLTFTLMIFALSALITAAAQPPNFTGEYADKKFLNGQAVFQLSLEQSGNTVTIWFSAGYNNGREPAPEADATGKVNASGAVEFKFEDNDGNSGTGTITRAGNGVIVSIKATKVQDKRVLVFYRDGIRLERQTKA
jgi:hypothetical protein